MVRAVSVLLCVCATVVAAPGVPAFFIANQGQAPGKVRFLAKSSGLTAYFLAREIRLRVAGALVQVRFEGANPHASVEGINPLPGRANFLIGRTGRWHTGVPTFAAVRYRALYPGIDMIYGGAGRQLKSEFIVAPGADPSRIRIRYRGAGTPVLMPDGALAMQALREAAPFVYQEQEGTRTPVDGYYEIRAGGVIGFALGNYDRTRPLIIDPLMSYNTLVGSSSFNAATAVAVDSGGSAYIAGYTDSDSLPTANPAQNFNRGGVEVFVAKLNPAGNTLEYCTYLGGSDDDRAYGIAVDSSGSAYVTGTTTSPDFPTRNPEQSSLEGSRNAFVFKLNPLGDMLEFSTYLGGSGADTAYGIALDSLGNSYIVGDTTSLNFPANGFQTANQGGQDAFVAELSSSGTQLVFATYLGGGGTDHGGAIALDSAGTIYITGSTWSSNFPTQNPYQSKIAGPCNVYIAHLSANGSNLLFATYLGGSGCTMSYPESGQGIAVDTQGNTYVAGVTSSADFPVLNAVQPQIEGSTDAFVAKFDSAGALLFNTFMGGSGVDVGNAIAVDASGAIYVGGYTYSTDFPVTAGALQALNAGGCDAFLFKLAPMGDTLLYGTYVGGSGADTASGVAVDASGNVYLGGWTLSPNFPGVR